MKNFLIGLLVIIGLMVNFDISFASCAQSADAGFDVGDALDGCLSDSKLVDGSDATIGTFSGASNKIVFWVDNLSLYLGLFAVGSIVFGALMMIFSGGEEEKLKKGKDVVKWGIVGFIGLLSVSAIISLIVKIMYTV